jgi:hypothetical protein
MREIPCAGSTSSAHESVAARSKSRRVVVTPFAPVRRRARKRTYDNPATPKNFSARFSGSFRDLDGFRARRPSNLRTIHPSNGVR